MTENEQTAVVEQPTSAQPNVFQAVAKAAKAAKIAGLDSTNTYDKYDYRSIRGVMDAVHLAMADAGVTVVLHEMLDLQRSIAETQKGGKQVLITYVGVFRVYGPAGDHFELQHYCEGMDRSDKAANKASSAGYKEVLQKLLTLPFGHDEVEEDSDDRGPAQHQPQRGNQRNAIDNRPKKVPPPWSGKPDWSVRYDSEHHVHVKLVEGRVLQADARNMRSEDLTGLEEGLPQRQAWFNQNGFKALAEQAARDLRIVSNELLIRSGDMERPADEQPATDDTPSDDTQNETPADSADDAATSEDSEPAEDAPAAGEEGSGAEASTDPEAGQDGPDQPGPTSEPSLRRTEYAVHIDVEDDPEKIPTAKGLSPEETEALLWLHPSEIVAMALSPKNASLFEHSAAAAVQKLAAATGAAAPFSADWFVRAWLMNAEADKKLRRDARKLCRLSIAALDLAKRAEGKQVEIGTRELTDDERVQITRYLVAMVSKDDLDEALAGLAALTAPKAP
jgi:hypothetical protein